MNRRGFLLGASALATTTFPTGLGKALVVVAPGMPEMPTAEIVALIERRFHENAKAWFAMIDAAGIAYQTVQS